MTIGELARHLPGQPIPVDASHVGYFVGVPEAEEAAGLITTTVRFTGPSLEQRWQLRLRLDSSDAAILADGGPDVIDAYVLTLAALVAEWRHTGLTSVVIAAHQLP